VERGTPGEHLVSFLAPCSFEAEQYRQLRTSRKSRARRWWR